MKFVKSVVLAVVMSCSVSAYAQGVEEVCHRSAETNVRLKNVMQRDPSFLEFALSELAKANITEKTKAQGRENYYWVFNRRTMSDEDIRRLSFIGCLVRLS